MKSLLRFVYMGGMLLLFFVIQFSVSYLMPFPVSTVHVPTLIVTLYLLLKERRRIVWYMFGFFFLLELLVPSVIYGYMIIPGVLSTFFAYWCHKFFFTNRSLYTGVLVAGIMLLSYRSIEIIYSFVVSAFMPTVVFSISFPLIS